MQDFQSNSDNFWVSGVQSSLDWDNQLWDDWKHLSATFLEHVEDTLHGKESVWINLFSDTLEENWEIMMVIQLLNVDFPVDFVLWTVFDGNWEITSIVE